MGERKRKGKGETNAEGKGETNKEGHRREKERKIEKVRKGER